MANKTKQTHGCKDNSAKPAIVVEASPSQCPKCLSTQRTGYTQTIVQAYSGLAKDRRPYTHIVRRRCQCLACGQHRIDRSLENRG
jgi:hypothetical protein